MNRWAIILCLSIFIVIGCEKDKHPDKVNDVCKELDDINFMRYCYDNYDVNHDHVVSLEEANAVKSINVASCEITSLKGIESFSGLVNLDCSGNQLKILDVSKNEDLDVLNCLDNPSLETIWYGDKLSLLDLKYDIRTVKSFTNKAYAKLEGKWGLLKEVSKKLRGNGATGFDYVEDYDPYSPEDAQSFTITKGKDGTYTISKIYFWTWDMDDWYDVRFTINIKDGQFTISCLDGDLHWFCDKGLLLITDDMLSFEYYFEWDEYYRMVFVRL